MPNNVYIIFLILIFKIPDRDSRFLNNNFIRGGNFGDFSGAELAVLNVGCKSCTYSSGFCGSVYANKNNIGSLDSLINSRREK